MAEDNKIDIPEDVFKALKVIRDHCTATPCRLCPFLIRENSDICKLTNCVAPSRWKLAETTTVIRTLN